MPIRRPIRTTCRLGYMQHVTSKIKIHRPLPSKSCIAPVSHLQNNAKSICMAYIVRNMIEVTITALRLGWTTQREAAVRDTDIVITISHTSLKA